MLSTALTWITPAIRPRPTVHSLMACGCANCEDEAVRLGYDFAAMRRGVLALRQRLHQLTAADVRALAAGRPGLMDFLGLLAQDGSVLDWIQFRAHILAERMGEFRAAVQEAAEGCDKVFGSDVFPRLHRAVGRALVRQVGRSDGFSHREGVRTAAWWVGRPG